MSRRRPSRLAVIALLAGAALALSATAASASTREPQAGAAIASTIEQDDADSDQMTAAQETSDLSLEGLADDTAQLNALAAINALRVCDDTIRFSLLSSSSVTAYFGWSTSVYAENETWRCYAYQGSAAPSWVVNNIQHTLNECYGENLLVDGDFGSLTRAAVIRMQQTEGLVADGYYGPQSQRWSKHPASNGNCYYGTAFNMWEG